MELVTTKICMTSQIGVHKNLFGGELMSSLDESAAAYACQICDTPRMVTRKIEDVAFEIPVKVGDIYKIYAEVERIGRTSITLKLEARKHSVYSGIEKLVCSTKMVFVRIDEDGSPVPISERVKKRHIERMEKYGRGLLTPEEFLTENKK